MSADSTVAQLTIQSENGFEDVFKDKPMSIKVKQVKIEEKPMATNQVETARTYINLAIETADSMLETKKARLDSDVAKNRLGAFQGVGDILKGVMKFVPGPENPMIGKLNVLETKIRQVGEKMSHHFEEMKEFITEIKFFMKIVNPTLVLTKCMRDCLKFPVPEAVENFRDAYTRAPPLKIAYHLLSYLEHHSTNPLRLAMEAEPVKTKAKFEKWENIITRVFDQFWVLEAFAKGFLSMTSQFNCDLLLKRAKEISIIIDEWRKEYTDNEKYWKEMKTWMEDYIPNGTHLNNSQKAIGIRDKLNEYLTTDAFYIFVFNDCEFNRDYTYFCPKSSEQILGVWRKGKCNAFIYRSRTANLKNDKDLQKIQDDLSAATAKLRIAGTMKNMIEDQLVNKNILKGYGFICLINKKQNAAIAHANFTKSQRGPGGNTEATVRAGLLIVVLVAETYNFVASFD